MRSVLFTLLLTQCASAEIDFQLAVTGPANTQGTVIPGLPATIAAFFNNASISLPSTAAIEIGGKEAFAVSAPGGGLTVVVPANIPPGVAQLSVTENGGVGVTNVNVVDFLVFTNTGGIGQALAQNVVAGVVETNNLTHPAHPGDTVTLYGAGIASATQFGVLLGGHPATVTYAGPAPSLPGIDQINFQVPDDPVIPNGCFVAVQVTVNGSGSNVASISTAAAGATSCTPPIDLTAAQMAQLDAGQSIPVASFSIDGLAAEQSTSSGFLRNESFNVQMMLENEATLALMSPPLLADDVFYSCTASSGAAIALINESGGIDLGPKLTLTGPDATAQILTTPGQSYYSLSLPTGPPVSSPAQLPPPFFVSGVWQIAGQASQPSPYSVEQYATLPFSAQITTPPTLQLTDYASLQTINPEAGTVVTWSIVGFGPSDVVTVTVGGAQTVTCRAHATDGQLSIPPSLLQTISAPGEPVNPTVPFFQISATLRPDQRVRADIPLVAGGLIPGTFIYSFTESFPVVIP